MFISCFAESVSDVRDLCCLLELPSKAGLVDALVFFSDSTAYGFDTGSEYLDIFRVHRLQRQAVFLVHSAYRNYGFKMDAVDLR